MVLPFLQTYSYLHHTIIKNDVLQHPLLQTMYLQAHALPLPHLFTIDPVNSCLTPTVTNQCVKDIYFFSRVKYNVYSYFQMVREGTLIQSQS